MVPMVFTVGAYETGGRDEPLQPTSRQAAVMATTAMVGRMRGLLGCATVWRAPA